MSELDPAIARMVDATNRADTDAFVACFTGDAFLSDWGREFHGHAGAASWDSTDNIGVNAHFEVLGVRDEGDEQVVTMKVSGGGYNGTGDIRFTTRDGYISRMLIA
jgi:hypothetical protein